jgi:RNA polymerase sigma-70 factor, ECF subfamily
VIADALRTAARRPVDARELDESLPAAHVDPLERLRLVEALAKLSDEHRAAVVDIHLVGTPYAEAADAAGVPVATLRTRVFYALRALRGHLDGQDHDHA